MVHRGAGIGCVEALRSGSGGEARRPLSPPKAGASAEAVHEYIAQVRTCGPDASDLGGRGDGRTAKKRRR